MGGRACASKGRAWAAIYARRRGSITAQGHRASGPAESGRESLCSPAMMRAAQVLASRAFCGVRPGGCVRPRARTRMIYGHARTESVEENRTGDEREQLGVSVQFEFKGKGLLLIMSVMCVIFCAYIRVNL